MEKEPRRTLLSLLVLVLLSAGVVSADIVAGLSTTNTSSNVSLTQLVLSTPSDVVVGDVLLATIAINGGSPVSITPPSGWTFIARSDNDSNISIATYYKVLNVAESTTYTWSMSPQTRAVGGITKYSGVSVFSPIDVVGTSSGRGTVATAPSVITTSDETRVVAVFAINAGLPGSPAFSTTTGMTKRYDAKYSPLGPTMAAEDAEQSTAGATGSKSVTVSTFLQRDWVAQTIVLRVSPNTIEFDSASESNDVSGIHSGMTGNPITISGSDTILLCGIFSNQALNNLEVTFDGNSMTQIGTTNNYSGADHMYLFGLLNPTTGSSISPLVTWDEIEAVESIQCASYRNVNQSALPSITENLGADTANSFIATIMTSSTPGSWVVMYARNSFGTFNPIANFTVRSEVPGSGAAWVDSNGPVPINSAYSMYASWGGPHSWGTIQVELNPSI